MRKQNTTICLSNREGLNSGLTKRTNKFLSSSIYANLDDLRKSQSYGH